MPISKPTGLNTFVKPKIENRTITTVTATTYTILITDELINFTGTSACTMTLLDTTTLPGTVESGGRNIVIQNNGTAAITFTPATGQTMANGKSTFIIYPNESVTLSFNSNRTDVDVIYPNPVPAMIRHSWCKAVSVSSTAANVFDADGAPANIRITGAMAFNIANGSAAIATGITVTTGSTLLTISVASNVAATAVQGATSISATYQNVAAGAAITATAGANITATLILFGETQHLA